MRILYSRMVLSAKALLDEIPHPTDDQIETAIEEISAAAVLIPDSKAIKTVIDDQP